MDLIDQEKIKSNATVAELTKMLASNLHSPRSRSLWVEGLSYLGLLKEDTLFFSPFSESFVQSDALCRLANGEKIDEPEPTCSSRQYFSCVVQRVITLSGRHHDCNSENAQSMGSPHKPNYLLRSADSAGESSIVMVGQVIDATCSDCEFADEDVGQILHFIQQLLLHQGWRRFAIGFLTDGNCFEFFRGSSRETNTLFTRSGVFVGGAGWTRLSRLMQQSNAALDYQPVILEGWQVGEWLGTGGSSSVFAVTSTSTSTDGGDSEVTSAVCKVYFGKNTQQSSSSERRALTKMCDDAHTPKIASSIVRTTTTSADVRSFAVLVMTPRGRSVGYDGARLPIDAFSTLVGTLETCHSRGLCHNDICPDNIFAVDDDERVEGDFTLLLSDWESSMLLHEMRDAEKFHTRELYYDVSSMGPAEDLAALVRTVFVLTQCTFSPARVHTTEDLDCILRDSWDWGKALQAARKTNYDAVRTFFNTGMIVELHGDDPISKRSRVR